MEQKEHVFEPADFPNDQPHKVCQCRHCGLREHNPVHVPPPKPEPFPEAEDQATYDARKKYNAHL